MWIGIENVNVVSPVRQIKRVSQSGFFQGTLTKLNRGQNHKNLLSAANLKGMNEISKVSNCPWVIIYFNFEGQNIILMNKFTIKQFPRFQQKKKFLNILEKLNFVNRNSKKKCIFCWLVFIKNKLIWPRFSSPSLLSMDCRDDSPIEHWILSTRCEHCMW